MSLSSSQAKTRHVAFQSKHDLWIFVGMRGAFLIRTNVFSRMKVVSIVERAAQLRGECLSDGAANTMRMSMKQVVGASIEPARVSRALAPKQRRNAEAQGTMPLCCSSVRSPCHALSLSTMLKPTCGIMEWAGRTSSRRR